MDKVEDARTIAFDILWKYIRFFSVFAELCDFFVAQQDTTSLTGLLLELAANETTFDDAQEKAFVGMAARLPTAP